MNFSGISNKSLVGKILRSPLNLIPKTTQMPILQGRLKGKKWIVGSSQHGCWLGSYEAEKQHLVEKIVTPNSIVFDIGAHTGFYTLLASVLVGEKGKVFAFEPLPKNIYYIKEHLRLNKINNVTLIEAAVSDHNGKTYFETTASSFEGHITDSGDLEVNTVGLDQLMANGEIIAPHYMKIDVEGAEMLLLTGAKSLLTNYHPTIFLATHGDEVKKQCCELLLSLGYQLKPIDNLSLDDTSEIIASYEKQ
jgi:FkbM family methyltransferase